MNKVIDRVPTYQGRIQLIPVDAEKGIYDMVRADEPTVVGTPLNAALFDSIAADLAKIAPPIFSKTENVANSKNVAFYSSLGAVGLECESVISTNSFLTSVLPLNSAVFCNVAEADTITLEDLGEDSGILLLMKGETADNVCGMFWKNNVIKVFAEEKWLGLATLTRAVLTVNGQAPDENGNVVVEGGMSEEEILAQLPETTSLNFENWENGTFEERLSDGTPVTHTVDLDTDGTVLSVDDISVTGISVDVTGV